MTGMSCPDNSKMTVTPIEPCPACDAEQPLIEIWIGGTDEVCSLSPEEAAKVIVPQIYIGGRWERPY
jgi:hypothetical protein